jgi:RND family efflux transporter MFP subunit
MKKIIIGVIALILVVLVAFKGKGLMEERRNEIIKEPLPQKRSISVSTTKPTQGSMKELNPFLATVRSDKSIKVSTKLAGYIQKIYVEESQKVNKGDLLATIDSEELNSNIAQLKSSMAQQQNDLALARQIYNRNQKLYHVGGLAKEQVDTSRVIMQGKKTVIVTTKEKIKQLGHQKSYLSIKAPFAGEVDSILQYEGDLALTGKPILSMSNGVKKLIFSFVAGKGSIVKGQKVFIDEQEIGSIKEIKTLAKQGLVQAEVAVNKPLTEPVGSSINIKLLTAEKQGCIVPSDTLLHKTEGDFVMTYKESKFQAMKVETLMSQENRVMVTPCPSLPIAVGSEVLLAKLPVYGVVEIRK